jgi:hypothetical protein
MPRSGTSRKTLRSAAKVPEPQVVELLVCGQKMEARVCRLDHVSKNSLPPSFAFEPW